MISALVFRARVTRLAHAAPEIASLADDAVSERERLRAIELELLKGLGPVLATCFHELPLAGSPVLLPVGRERCWLGLRLGRACEWVNVKTLISRGSHRYDTSAAAVVVSEAGELMFVAGEKPLEPRARFVAAPQTVGEVTGNHLSSALGFSRIHPWSVETIRLLGIEPSSVLTVAEEALAKATARVARAHEQNRERRERLAGRGLQGSIEA